MAKFNFVKRLDLERLGAETGSFLEFNPITYAESKGLAGTTGTDLEKAEQMLALVKEKFVQGVIGAEKVAKDELGDLPAEVLAEILKLIMGTPSPNSSTPSTS